MEMHLIEFLCAHTLFARCRPLLILIVFLVSYARVVCLSIDDRHDVVGGNEATIAFYIFVSTSTQHLVDRLFSRIYHQSSAYLIEYDHGISSRHYVKPASFPVANVYVRESGLWTQDGVTQAITMLDAMAFFIDRSEVTGQGFDYFIPLTPTSYPTLPPTNLARILHTVGSAHNWPSFFHFVHSSHLPFFNAELDAHYVDLALSFNRSAPKYLAFRRLGHPDALRRPFKFRVGRTMPLFIVSHRFVKFAIDSPKATRILVTLGETSHVHLRFFAALIQDSSDAEKGPVVRSTSLHCSDSDTIDIPVHIRKARAPSYRPKQPSMQFLFNTTKPCLFIGPFDESQSSVLLRNDIDERLGVFSKLMKGADERFGTHVLNKLMAVFSRSVATVG